jgi:hypothetical protein
MIGREFKKKLRLLNRRHETIKTRFELNKAGSLVEHVELETHDRPTRTPEAVAKALNSLPHTHRK